MTYTSIILAVSSLAILLAGMWAWRLTSSRSIFVNACFGSVALLLAAYEAVVLTQREWAIILPFFTTMLFAGRFVGLWWRSRKEMDLRRPAQLLGACAALALTATLTAFCHVR